ncbi:polysaccharide pyruvyl transferase family protein [Gemmobacter serpentinus]|uniref:polysaccharide pyruvyl transferase family protein n=1 Tax=Gemmobacter serpentinus TaxID=2652247 RepID=UPI0018658295|nr:polysaccharide pyruvyl transferase family protein [Gemmobacter serpentinus]
MHYLIGGSGIPNYGDELMARGWLRYLAQHHPEDRVVIDTTLPTVSTLLLQPAHWKASHVAIVREVGFPKSSPDFWKNFARGLAFFDQGGFAAFPQLNLAEGFLAQANRFHLFGGGYISSKWPNTGFLLGFAGALKARFGTRLHGTGLGLLPIDPPPAALQQAFRTVLNGFTSLELRDPAAEGFIRDHSAGDNVVPDGLDDCFMEPPPPLHDQPPTLHISCFMKDSGLAPLLRRLDRRRERISKRFEKIKFWVCAPHRDQDAFEAIRDLFPQTEAAHVGDLLADPGFSKDDVMITSRFHPHMIAARAGIRGYYIQISGDYYAAKHQSVVALGSRFLPFADFETRNFDLEPCTAMAKADAERVTRKQKRATAIYGGNLT